MVKKEFKELEKLFQIRRCGIDRIAGCYVGAGKEIKAVWQQAFQAMDEEDILKYLSLFKKALSGRNTKEIQLYPERKEALEALRESRLKDRKILEEFFRETVEAYEAEGNYLILAVHETYDVPGKAADGKELEDGEDIYEYILAVICPVSLQKPGLAWDLEKGVFTHLDRDWIAKDPAAGILFPAFNGRGEDREHTEFYMKKRDADIERAVERLFRYSFGDEPEKQREAWEKTVSGVLGKEGTVQQAAEIEGRLREYARENATVGKEEALAILSPVLQESQKGRFEAAWEEHAGQELGAEEIAKGKTIVIAAQEGVLRMPDYAVGNVSVQEDGEGKYLMVRLDGKITVNGVEV